MENNFASNALLSSLIPFIEGDEFSYYSQFDIHRLTVLTSLAPFVNTPKQLKILSMCDLQLLHKLSEQLPNMDSEEINNFFTSNIMP